MIGTELNHYRITELLGSGGMGEVYAGEDTKLKRRVAIKLLPVAVAAEPERRQRFEREARAIAALNHPNIVTVHSIEQSGEHLFLTMELVRGKVLAELIPPRGLPIERLLTFAIPLADGVGAAHQHGVIHRDLKPANVMVADDGRVKVLDFGIARLLDAGDADGAGKALTTAFATGARPVMGTVAYMSPEQAEGRPVDARSDIFSLGIVLYEMATGERPFKGETPVSILSSIIKEQPATITTLNPGLPPELARIVRRCLAKDPARRYQTAVDVRNDLQELEQQLDGGVGLASQPPPTRPGGWREGVAWAIAVLLAMASLATWFARAPSAPVDTNVDVLSMLAPDDTNLTEGEAPVLSPNGRLLAFIATDGSGRTRVYVRDRGSAEPRVLEGTDDAAQPFWSPDGRSIGFFAAGQLKRIDVAGGSPRSLAPAPVPRGGTWTRDGRILFVGFPEDPPQLIDAEGGAAQVLPVNGAADWRWFPSLLPNGRDYLYQSPSVGIGRTGVMVGSTESADATMLVPMGLPTSPAIFVEPGYVLYRRERTLVAQPFDPVTKTLGGDPITIAESIAISSATGQPLYSVSDEGGIAYVGPGQGWQLAWFDREGLRAAPIAVIDDYNSLCLSVGDTSLVYDDTVNLWSLDLVAGRTTRLTFEHSFYASCAATTDEVVFAGTRDASPNLFRLAFAAPGGEEPLAPSALPSLPSDWSSDGRFVLYSAYSRATSWDLWAVPLEGGEPFSYLATAAEEKNAQLSPDGRWVAYTSNQDGTEEVYVQPFPAGEGRWQVSRGGRQPSWRADGREFYYVSLDKRLIAVDVDTSGPRFVHGAGRMLVETVRGAEAERTYHGLPYAVTADGERFVVASPADATRPITIMLNWPALLQREDRQ